MRLKLTLEYDGAGFRGWAAQPGLRTLRTDVNGRIVVESDGRTLTVRSER